MPVFNPPGAVPIGSITGMTEGAIPFGAPDGSLTQDPPNLFWNDSEDRMGIGTNDPQQMLHIVSATSPRIRMEASSSANVVVEGFRPATGEGQAIWALNAFWGTSLSSNQVGQIRIEAGPDTANEDDGVIAFRTATGGVLSERMRIDENGNVGIGTDEPDSIFHIEAGVGNLKVSGTNVGWIWEETDAATDNGNFQFLMNSNDLKIRALNDNFSEKYDWITFESDTGNIIVNENGATNIDFNIKSSLSLKRTAVAGNLTTSGDTFIGVTDTSSARTITLASADAVAGRIIIIKDESGGASTNNITIDTEGSEMIDGVSFVTIVANYGVVKLYSDGTNWFTL